MFPMTLKRFFMLAEAFLLRELAAAVQVAVKRNAA
jgi:hypothetical protein